MFRCMPTLMGKITENERISILMNVTRTLYEGLQPTSKTCNEVFDEIFMLMDEWVFENRNTLPYVEETAWVRPFIKFMQCAEFYGIEFFWGVLHRHFYPRVFLSLDALNAWSSKHERLKCFADGNRYKTPRPAICNLLEKFEKLAYEPELRRAPEGSLLRQEYDKLERELYDIAHGKNANHCDVETSYNAAPEIPAAMVVEIDDASVKKLAGATGAAVKKAIKPGRGSAKERFPEETKQQCQGIWEKYKDNPEVKKCATRRKVSHNDVFEYAKTELARLEPVHILAADEFKRALGAKSDKKYRNSPAVRKRNRDKKRQAVYLPQKILLSDTSKCRP